MKNLLITFLACLIPSCVSKQPALLSELAMTPGMQIDAETEEGHLEIRYIDTYTREYLWGSMVKRFTHQPRRERWYGSLGMYRPHGDGSMHAVLEEGQQHFTSVSDAYVWIKKQERFMDFVWTSDGLAVGWKQQARPDDGYLALSVEVWQIYINGSKAKLKTGSSNRKIRCSYVPIHARHLL